MRKHLPLATSASVPTLSTPHATHLTRAVPRLALVPLDQLQKQQEAHECQHTTTNRDDEDEETTKTQQRLGERFLQMLLLLTCLSRMDLDGTDSHSSPTVSTSALEVLQQRKHGAPSPTGKHQHPPPVTNVATEPLREHLTFEISMLLPAPIDTRQSPLHSPIQRLPRKKRRRRRRRKRPSGATMINGKRTWQTSQTTWLPRASAAYIEAHGPQDEQLSGSRLVAKFAALRRTTREPTLWKHGVKSMPTLPSLHARNQSLHENEEEDESRRASEEQGSTSNEDSSEEDQESEPTGPITVHQHEQVEVEDKKSGEDDDYDDKSHMNSAALPSSSAASIKRVPASRLAHSAAWISPELRRWLLETGMFRTESKSKHV